MKKIIKIATNEVVTIEGSILTIEQVESEKDITKLNDGIFKTDERILILHGGIEILHLSDSGIHIKPMPAITKENTTTENSDVIKRKIVIENKAEFMNFIKAANEYLSTIQK